MSFGGASAGINSFGARMLQNCSGADSTTMQKTPIFARRRRGVGAGKTGLSRNFMHDGNRSMQIKKRSDRTKLLEQ